IDLGECIVNRLEGCAENMSLSVPEGPVYKRFYPVIITVGKIFFLKLLPFAPPLFGCEFRFFIDDMLELINRHPVWKKGDVTRHMGEFELVGVLFKEELHPWICEIFHAH